MFLIQYSLTNAPKSQQKQLVFHVGEKKLCQPQLLVAESKFLSADHGSCKLPVPALSTLPDVFTQIKLKFCFLYGTFRLLKQYKFVICFSNLLQHLSSNHPKTSDIHVHV